MEKRHPVRTVSDMVKWKKLVTEKCCKTNQSKVPRVKIRICGGLPGSEQTGCSAGGPVK